MFREALLQELAFWELDIKKLKGNLLGFSRIRVGKIRIIFEIRRETSELFIYDINYRGNIYQ